MDEKHKKAKEDKEKRTDRKELSFSEYREQAEKLEKKATLSITCAVCNATWVNGYNTAYGLALRPFVADLISQGWRINNGGPRCPNCAATTKK